MPAPRLRPDWAAPWRPLVRRLRVSVATQVLTIVSLLLVVILGSYGVIEARRARELGVAALRERARLLAAVHADALAAAMWDFNNAQVEALLTAFTLDPDFVAATVTEVDGTLVARRRVGERTAPDAVSASRAIRYSAGGRIRPLGQLELSLGTDRLERELAGAGLRRVGVLAMLGGSVFAVILLSFRRVSVPLRQIAAAVARLSRGELGLVLPGLGRGDEIGGIVRALEAFRVQSLEVDRLRRLQERASLEDRLRIRAAVDSSADAVVIGGIDGQTLYVNPAARKLLGVPADTLPCLRRIVRRLRPAGQARALARTMRHRGAWHGEVGYLAAAGSGGEVRLWLRVDEIRGQDGARVGYVMLGTDVTERHLAQARIQFLAHHDSLTGLPNRMLLRERLEAALAGAASPHRRGALLLLDLDRFKEVNDTLGHPMGDALLCAVTGRLRSAVRDGDTVARLGGDEFAVLLAAPVEPEAAIELARRLVAEMALPFDIEGHRLFVGTSVGAALLPDHGATPDLLLVHADLALYRAKAHGRGTHVVYDPALGQRAQRRKGLSDAIRRGLAASEFVLHYQPRVELATGVITGCAALARWSPPGHAAVPPDEFIPAAAACGLMGELGDRMLVTACGQMRRWLDQGADPGRITLSLPAAQLQAAWLPRLKAVLAETGIDAARLEIEVADVAMAREEAATFRLLGELRVLGIGMALAGLGGATSLSHLRRFPFERITIDRALVAELRASPGSAALVGGLVELGHRLGLRITAEGIGSADQLDRLRALGCDEGQGEVFGPPGPAEMLDARLLAGAASVEGRGAHDPTGRRPDDPTRPSSMALAGARPIGPEVPGR